jgi:hypothetical protein
VRKIFSREWYGVGTALLCAGLTSCGGLDPSPDGDETGASAECLWSAGSLDNTFGNSGVVVTRAVSPVGATNVALQTDGKIVVVATLADSPAAAQVFGVVRYLPNGTLDLGFGNRGVVRTDRVAKWS